MDGFVTKVGRFLSLDQDSEESYFETRGIRKRHKHVRFLATFHIILDPTQKSPGMVPLKLR